MRKCFWPVFYRMFEFDKPQATVYISPEASLTITDEKLRSFLHDLRGCWKHNFLKKKRQSFQWRKDFGLLFLIWSKIRESRKQLLKAHKVCLTIILQFINNFSLGPKRSIARNFSKSSSSQGDKSFWLTFHRNNSCHKTSGKVYNCTQSFWQLLWKL